MKLACMRCQRVLPLEVEVDGQTYTSAEDSFGLEPDQFTVDIAAPPGGVLMAICLECTSPREAHQRLMQLASAMLETAEDYIEQIEGVGKIQPALLDNPEVKASLIKAHEQAAEARAQLAALSAVEGTLDDE